VTGGIAYPKRRFEYLQPIPRRRLEVVNSRRDVEHLQLSLHDPSDAFSEFIVTTLGFIAISD